jgi:hypothetical protein
MMAVAIIAMMLAVGLCFKRRAAFPRASRAQRVGVMDV